MSNSHESIVEYFRQHGLNIPNLESGYEMNLMLKEYIKDEFNILVSTGINEFDGLDPNKSKYGYWVWYFDGEHNQCEYGEDFETEQIALTKGLKVAISHIDTDKLGETIKKQIKK